MAESGPANDFYYSPLSAPGLLRLLKVLPERLDDRLQICLWESLPSVPYRCLSYMWGDQTEKFPILVNGHVYKIGKSLHTFLETAQQKFPNETLWIDAICINQSDNAEKSLQVQRMGKTFSKASEVLIWLGHSQLIAELFRWLASICDVNENIDESRLERLPKFIYKAVGEFSSHPYWNRAWITQEVMLSQRSRLLCGTIETTAKAVFTLLWKYYKNEAFLSLRHDLRNILSMLQRIGDHRPIDFRLLARERRQTQCENPRDRLFSLLAIIRHDTSFTVDYDESLVSLYLRSVRYFSAWKNQLHMAELVYLLGLDRSTISSQMQSERGDAYLNIPMGHSIRLNDLHHISFWSQHPVQGYPAAEAAADAVFLHLRSAEDEGAYTRPFLKMQRSESSGAEDSFSLHMYSSEYNSVRCPVDTEIWTNNGGTATRLGSWTDMIGIVGSNAHMEDSKEVTQLPSEAELIEICQFSSSGAEGSFSLEMYSHSEAEFIVKLPLRAYILDCLEKWQGWNKGISGDCDKIDW